MKTKNGSVVVALGVAIAVLIIAVLILVSQHANLITQNTISEPKPSALPTPGGTDSPYIFPGGTDDPSVFTPQPTSSNNDREKKATVEIIRVSLELYRYDKKTYPESLDLLMPKYLQKLPTDPSTGINYSYKVSEDLLDYNLETTFDSGEKYTVTAPK